MRNPSLDGWRLFIVSGAIILAATLGFAGLNAFSTESLRWGIRFTARSSALLFLLAFTASAAFALLPNDFTRWQRANRRFLGLAFAFSHLVHAGFIIAFAAQGPEQYAEAITPDMIIVGSIGYALIILMAATSFRATATLIGPRNWKILHTIGIHWLWLQFVVAFGKRAVSGGPIYWAFLGVLIAALAIRLVAIWRKAGAPRRDTA